MSARFNRRELGAALAKIKPVIRSGPLEILRRVRLEKRPDASSLTITGTDLRCSVSAEVACEGGADRLEAVVDHGRLAEVCGAEWAEELEAGVGEDGKLDVRGETRTRLAVFPVADFPSIEPPPEGGEWLELGAEVIEAIQRAAAWVVADDGKWVGHVQKRFVWVFGTVAGGEPAIAVFGGRDHAGFCRYLPGVVPAALGCLAIGRQGALLAAGLAGGAGIELLDGKGRHYFRGKGWWASEVKGETNGADIRTFLDNPALKGSGMRFLPPLVNVLKVLEAAPKKVAGTRERTMLRIRPVSPSGSTCYLSGEDVSWSGETAADLPAFQTYYPEELGAMLRELDRIAGTERVVEVGLMREGALRFEIEDRAVAFVMGAVA